MRAPNQLALFGGAETPKTDAVEPARVSDEVRGLAARLPQGVFLGGSSWSYPGWAGHVWATSYAEARLARHGLAAYGQHPLLRAVGIDRTHYRSLSADEFARFAAQVPDDFRFLVKAHEDLTHWRFPDRERYGARRGQGNPRFLDPELAIEQVVIPASTGLGAKLGAVVFEFAPQEFGRPRDFARDLDAFLAELPPAVHYGIELRNRELLTPDYAAVLAARGACHVFNVHPRMPDLPIQRRVVAPGPRTIVRWLVARGMTYEETGARFAPFDRIHREDANQRARVAELLGEAVADGRLGIATINNNAEGCAPLSIVELATRLTEEPHRSDSL